MKTHTRTTQPDSIEDPFTDNRDPRTPVPKTERYPTWEDAADLVNAELPVPPAIVEGLIRSGDIAVIGGPSKSFKSWAALDLAICVAHGQPWLERATIQGRVLFVNHELPRWCIQQRIDAIARARGQALEPGQLLVWTLRGKKITAEKLHAIVTRNTEAPLAMIVVDPCYKLLDNRDENSTRDIGNLFTYFEALAEETGAAVVIPHHYTKGDASAKVAQDRVSGSGVFARAPDSLIAFTRHEEQDAFTVESVLRTFRPVEPFAIRWQFPVFIIDRDLDPSKLRRANNGTFDVHFDAQDICTPLAGGRELNSTDWCKAAMDETGISRRSFYRFRKDVLKSGRVVPTGPPGDRGTLFKLSLG